MTVIIENGQMRVDEQFLGPYQVPSTGNADGVAGMLTTAQSNGGTAASLSLNGGAMRMTVAASEDDTVMAYGPLAFEVDESRVASFQCRIRCSDVSVASLILGWTDAFDVTMPFEDEDGTINSLASDFCGILLEGEQDATWQTVGVQNDVDNAQAASTNITDLADNIWTTIKVDLYAANGGTMVVWVDGAVLTTATTNNNLEVGSAGEPNFFRSGVVLCPVIGLDARNTTFNVDVTEVVITGGVGDGT